MKKFKMDKVNVSWSIISGRKAFVSSFSLFPFLLFSRTHADLIVVGRNHGSCYGAVAVRDRGN